MRQNLSKALSLLFFLFLLLFPRAAFTGASRGLLLWFRVILPSLLPFFILTGILLGTNAIHWVSCITAPLFRRIFHVSPCGSFIILAGFLCGYPMGSRLIAESMRSRKITQNEGRYLLSFCNNTSPMFILSYLVLQNLEPLRESPVSSLTAPTLLILFASPVICSFLFRRRCPAAEIPTDPPSRPEGTAPNPHLMDDCILSSFESMVKIGGYMILFSILAEFVSLLPFKNNLFPVIFLSFLEMTNGIVRLCQSALLFPDKYILCLALTSFGGWCSIAQTKCMIQGTGLSILSYTKEKLVTMTLTSFLAFFYLLLFCR